MGSSNDGNRHYYSAFYNGTSSELYENGTLIASGDAGTDAMSDITLGARFDQVEYLDGNIQEFFMFGNDDRSDGRIAIEEDVNDYYDITSTTEVEPIRDFLITDVEFWENSQTYSPTGDPLRSLHYDVASLYNAQDVNGTSVLTGKTHFEILKEMGTAFLCRLYQSGGKFRFENIANKENASIKQVIYDVDNNETSASVVNVSKTISNNSFGSYIGRDNLKLKLPAFKRVTIEQTTNNGNNENQYIVSANNLSQVIDLGIFDTDEQLAINLTYNGTFDFKSITTTPQQDYNSIVRVQMRLKSTDLTGGIVYYNGSVWQSQDVTFDVDSKPHYIDSQSGLATSPTFRTERIEGVRQVQVKKLASAGGIELTLDYDGIKAKPFTSPNNPYVDIESNYHDSSSTFADNQEVVVSFEDSTLDGEDTIETMSSINQNVDINDNEIFEYGQVQFGDGGFRSGRIYVKGASSKTSATEWSFKNESQNKRMFNLLCDERLALQSRPVEIYDGTLGYIEGYFKTIVKDSNKLLPMDLTFNAFDANFQGRWYVLQKNTSNINPRDIDRKEKDYFKGDSNNKDGGFISGKFVILGDEDGGGVMGGGLHFDGTEEQQNAVTKFNLNQGFKAKINTLTYTATGQSQAITEDMHLVLLDTNGENFNVNANMPASADVQGQEFIIITKDDNHSGSSIALVANGSDTIDGSSTYTLQHASDKVILRCIGTNYYVQ